MSPDILVGPAGLAVPNSQAAGATNTGPPGTAGVAALFAALLAHNSSPPLRQIAAISPGLPGTSALKENAEPTKAAKEVVTAKAEPSGNASLPLLPPLPINTLVFAKPTLPPTAGRTANMPNTTQKITQNAMDTVPVSVSPPAKSVESKPGGELPLSEARTATSAPLPVFSGLLVKASLPAGTVSVPSAPKPLPAAGAVMALPSASLPHAAPTAVMPGVSLPPSVTLGLHVFSFASPVALSSVSAASAPVTKASAPAVETAATMAQNRPSPVRDASEIPVRAGGLRAFVAANSFARPEPANAPYVVTAQVVKVPAAALAQPAPAVVVQKMTAPPPSTAQTPKAMTAMSAFPPVAAPLPQSVAQTRPGSVTAAVTPVKPAAMPPSAPVVLPTVIAAVVIAAPVVKIVVASEEKTFSPLLRATEATVAPGKATHGTGEMPLKSQAAPADTNTRVAGTKAAPAAKTAPTELRLQVVGKRSERDAKSVAPEDAAPVLTQTVASPTGVEKSVTAPLTHAERAQIVQQAADGVEGMRLPSKPGATDQMTLQLHPKDWGQIQITVRVVSAPHAAAALNAVRNDVQTQTVTAHVVAETPQVKAALENGAGDLRHALREAGLHLDRLTVTVQSAGAGSQAGMSPGHHQSDTRGQSFARNFAEQKADSGSNANAATPSFAGGAGNSQGGRHGSQPQAAYTGPYTEPEREGAREWNREPLPRQPGSGKIDMQA